MGGLAAATQSFHAHDRARRMSSEQMSDVTANSGGGGASGFALPDLANIGALFKRGDIALAIGVMTILVVLILPLPPTLLDLALAISIILSVLILMTALFIHARSNSPPSRPCS
jgi:flagellar biosynthesis protein FlhA